jgi:hypothetical protein
MTYLIITAAICSLICLVLVARLILKDTNEYIPCIPAEPYVFKHVEELKSKTVGIPGTEGGHQRINIDENNLLDLTGLSTRAKKAITSTGAFSITDLEIGTLGFYLKNTKGVGPKTLAEINAWSVANYDIKIIDR